MTRRIPLSILAFFLGLAILAVQIDEKCSRHESTWTDGGGRHVVEIPSVKLSDED